MPQRASRSGATVERITIRHVKEGVPPTSQGMMSLIADRPEGNVPQFGAQDLVNGARHGKDTE